MDTTVPFFLRADSRMRAGADRLGGERRGVARRIVRRRPGSDGAEMAEAKAPRPVPGSVPSTPWTPGRPWRKPGTAGEVILPTARVATADAGVAAAAPVDAGAVTRAAPAYEHRHVRVAAAKSVRGGGCCLRKSRGAERAGFEPAVRFDPHAALAKRCFRPLSHLSKTNYIKDLGRFFVSS